MCSSDLFWPGGGASAMLPDRPDLTYWNELLDTVLGQPLAPNPDRTVDPDAMEVRRVAIVSEHDLWIPPPFHRAPAGLPEVRLFGLGHLHPLHPRHAPDAVARPDPPPPL